MPPIQVTVYDRDGKATTLTAERVELAEVAAPAEPPAPAPAPVPAPAPPPAPAPEPPAPAPDPVTWTVIGREWDTLTVPPDTRVRYGVDRVFVERVASGQFRATNEFFGRDPVPGALKTVWAPAGTAIKPPEPAPAPAPAPAAPPPAPAPAAPVPPAPAPAAPTPALVAAPPSKTPAAAPVPAPAGQKAPESKAVAARKITSVSIFNTGGANPNLIVPHGLPLALGDLPAGSSLEYREADGTPRPAQIDQEASWPQDGSRTFVAPTVILPMDAGETRTLDVWVNTNPQSKAANVTRAQLAATSDFRIVLDQGEFGADSYSVSLNDILTNGPEFSQTTGWGANPTRGWQIVKSGPLCTEWDGWAVFRRTSDNAIDRHLVGEFNVAAFGNGLFNIEACVRYDTATGAKPGSTVGPAGVPVRWFRVRLMNGDTVLKQYGGTDAPGAITIAVSSVDVKENHIAWPSSQLDSKAEGRGFAFASSGEMPGGVEPGKPYWLGWQGWTQGGDFFSLHTCPSGCGGSKHARVKITSQGGGTITARPIAFVAWGQRLWICSDDRQRIWVGNTAPQGTVWTSPERVYLTQRSKAVQPFNLDTPDTGETQPLRAWVPGQHPSHADLPQGLKGTGNGGSDERIGFISRTEGRALAIRPLDPRLRAYALQLADWPDMTHYCFNDPATGLPLNITSQPPASEGITPMPAYYGTAYPRVRFSGDSANGSYKGGGPIYQPGPFHFDRDGSYIDPGYQPWLAEASHLPLHSYGAYLLTGRIRYWKGLVHTWHGIGCATSRSQSFNGDMPGYESVVAGFRGDHQFRGYCWLLRHIVFSRHVGPDGHPLKAFAEHESMMSHGAINNTIRKQLLNGLQRRFKLIPMGGNDQFISFNHSMFYIVYEWQRWLGYYSRFMDDPVVAPWLDESLNSWVDSDMNPDGTAPGHLPLVDSYFRYCVRKPGDGTEMQTRAEVLAWTHATSGNKEPPRDEKGAYIVGPYPYPNWQIATGNTDYPTTFLAAFIMGEWAGNPRAKKLAGRLQAYPGMSSINYTNNPRYNLARPAGQS